MKPADEPKFRFYLIISLVICSIAGSAFLQFSRDRYPSEWPPDWFEDITYIWYEGYHLRHGENPYERIVDGDMRLNRKYATYLPMFYLLSAGTGAVFPWYSQWLLFWRIVFFCCYAGIGITIFLQLYRRDHPLMAVLAFLVWMFNRWCLTILDIAHTDFFAIAFLLASVLLIRSHTGLSLLLLGVSLSIKHVGVILVPIYMVWLWQGAAAERRWGALLRGAFLIVLLPALVSIPFMVWNFEGFVRSILFSVTRYADGHFYTVSFDMVTGLVGFPAKGLMIFLMVLVFVLHASGRLGLLTAMFVVLLIFNEFNSVAFRQYMVWPLPFLLLIPIEGLRAAPRVIDVR